MLTELELTMLELTVSDPSRVLKTTQTPKYEGTSFGEKTAKKIVSDVCFVVHASQGFSKVVLGKNTKCMYQTKDIDHSKQSKVTNEVSDIL